MQEIKNDGLRYPGLNITFIAADGDLDASDTPFGLGKRGEWHIILQNRQENDWRPNRYAWHLLKSFETYMVLENCNAKTARIKAYLFAKRKGWKITTRVVDKKTLWVWRYGNIVPVGQGLYDAKKSDDSFVPEPPERDVDLPSDAPSKEENEL